MFVLYHIRSPVVKCSFIIMAFIYKEADEFVKKAIGYCGTLCHLKAYALYPNVMF